MVGFGFAYGDKQQVLQAIRTAETQREKLVLALWKLRITNASDRAVSDNVSEFDLASNLHFQYFAQRAIQRRYNRRHKNAKPASNTTSNDRKDKVKELNELTQRRKELEDKNKNFQAKANR